MSTFAEQLDRRLREAQTDEDFRAVVDWLVSKGWGPRMASESVAIWRLQQAGERLPDTPSR